MRWLAKAVHTFETDPIFQYRFHLIAMLFWICNFVAGTVVVICYPHLWLSIGVYYVFALSIYANYATDYDAVSASLAAKHSEAILAKMVAEAPEVGDGIHKKSGVVAKQPQGHVAGGAEQSPDAPSA